MVNLRHDVWATATRVGLGCSKFGSILGADRNRSERVVLEALACGVTYFDTADIYGQGESETILRDVLTSRASNTILATKIGNVFAPGYQRVSALKQAARIAAQLSPRFRTYVAAKRSAPLQKDFSRAYLEKALDRSFGRLSPRGADIVYLHSPDASVIRAGEAVSVLVEARRLGRLRMVGISCDTSATASLALDDARVDVIQLPFDTDPAFHAVLRKARSGGVAVVVRGLMHAYLASGSEDLTAFLGAALADAAITIALVGTTKPENIRAATSAAGAYFRQMTPHTFRGDSDE